MSVREIPSSAGTLPTVRGDVAIIGMACVYPGARNLVEFWRNVFRGTDCITDVPPGRWEPELFYDADGADDRISCKRGGYLSESFAFNPLKYGTMPRAIDGAEPDQFLVLRTAHEAIEDAGYLDRDLSGTRASFILGRGNYLGAGLANLLQRSVFTQQTLEIIKALHPEYSADELKAIKAELRTALPGFVPDTAPGLIPNIASGRVANRLDLTGPTFTIDAACASSLIATEIAVRDLLTGQCDLALAGGVHVFTDVPFLTVFTTLGALSKSGMIRPFDENCDGTLPGEGVGIVVLKRLADATRDGDRVYAVIKGVGSSSDGRAMSVTAPRLEGEVLALERAYAMSGISPRTIELIEAHGTGTPVGDPTELQTLRTVLGAREGSQATCAIGSIKSQIGHAMPAAGVASLIKTTLALYHGVLPPTLHCDRPSEPLRRQDSRFYPNPISRPWIRGAGDHARRAGINAFGFGGVNAHVVLEEPPPESRTGGTLIRDWDSEVCILQCADRAGLLAEARRIRDYVRGAPEIPLRDLAFTLNCHRPVGAHRMAIVATCSSDLVEKLSKAIERLSDAGCTQIKDTSGVYYFGESPLIGGKVAFLFPGLGSEHVNMMSQLCMHFPQVRACFDGLDRAVPSAAGACPSADIFPVPTTEPGETQRRAARLAKIERANPALLTANGAMFTLLRDLGIRPHMMTGHSSGEWVALPAAGMVKVDRFVSGMSRLDGAWRALSDHADVPQRVMLAVGADRDRVAELSRQIDRRIWIVNDNCIHQVVVVVRPEDAGAVRGALLAQGVVVESLPYEHGYHSEEFTHATPALREYFSSLNLKRPDTVVYSCATTKPYPESVSEIENLLADTFARPVRFRDTIEAMYEAGARIFVEVGPRGNLTAFVDDILRGRPHVAVAAHQHRKSDLTSLHHALAKLAALLVAMDLAPLYANRKCRTLSLDPAADRLVDEDSAPGTIRVPLHYKLMKLAKREPVPQVAAAPVFVQTPAPVVRESDQLLHAHFQLMERFLHGQEEIMQAYLGRAGVSAASAAAEVTLPAAPAIEPEPPNVQTLPQEAPVPAPTPVRSEKSLTEVLLSVVSDRTGYPIEMLDLDADMEADLGIDSIKRIEILGTLQQRGGEAALNINVDMERAAKLKTLRQVVEFLNPSSRSVAEPLPARHRVGLTFPGQIVHHVPHRELTVRRRIDLKEELYLDDHRFGPRLSEVDPTLVCLAVVPLTVSVETMAEAAAMLLPELRVIGAKDVQASKWIDFPRDDAEVVIDVHALAIGEAAVRVTVRAVVKGNASAENGAPLAEAVILLGDKFPSAPPADATLPKNSRPCRHTAEQLYFQRRMFHGPRFQGVRSLDKIGDDGLVAQLEVLPTDGLLRSNPAPTFHIDPFLLDAAGQLVGYWPVEFLDEGFVLFPIRIRELTLYQENLRPGERGRCRLHVREVGQRQLRADMDIFAPDGSLWMRIVGWEDWRFYWPRSFYDFWRYPQTGFVCESLSLGGATDDGDIECRRMTPVGELASGLWENLWAHLICSRQERDQYHSMPGNARRTQWLFGRAAAKEAVRAWVHRRDGLSLYPADVHIVQDEHGKPSATGHWVGAIGAVPHVSISHKGNVAVAAVGPNPVGIDLEKITARDESFEGVAFDADERRLLRDINGRSSEEWTARAWSAKEAAGKALGKGLPNGPASVRIRHILENGDDVTIACDASPALTALPREVLVRSVRDGDFVIGLAVCEEGVHAGS